eukprot:TRINITY_DN4862_c0_g2_i1.p1 TRINITY_DN4862_c0_g2~~TRINITY_DN4862_c0_g2_i1.p1  ORF type:complete len:771 (-),score=139.68 TRINITY_DN4862_c0_g2_i1:30-2297(-)
MNREYEALASLQYNELLVNKILKPSIDLNQYGPEKPNSLVNNFRNQNLFNQSQLNAINRSLHMKDGFLLIQGPPGTGKTTTITGIVSALLTEPHRKILICAPSNAAIDEIVIRLSKGIYGNFEAENHVKPGTPIKRIRNMSQYVPNMVRIGKTSNIIVQNFTIDRLIQRDTPKKSNKKKEQYASVKEKLDIIKDCSLVCTTLSTSGHKLMQKLKIDEFDTIIIDEASQSVELSTLIPLKFMNRLCILVGDPQQLPATVMSREATKYKYEQSLMERLLRNDFPVTLLDTQYRMHPKISKFPSDLFYDSRLIDGENVSTQSYNQVYYEDSVHAPFVFFNLESNEQRFSKSLHNSKEVEFAVKIVKSLKEKYGIDLEKLKIGVLTPYKKQSRNLDIAFRRNFTDGDYNNLEINTVDAFQGREMDIVILSCVRASQYGSIGFLADIRRMNVALTRAKYSLWVIGNASTLVKNTHWKKLVDHSVETDSMINVGDVKEFWTKNGAKRHGKRKRSLNLSKISPKLKKRKKEIQLKVVDKYNGKEDVSQKRKHTIISKDISKNGNVRPPSPKTAPPALRSPRKIPPPPPDTPEKSTTNYVTKGINTTNASVRPKRTRPKVESSLFVKGTTRKPPARSAPRKKLTETLRRPDPPHRNVPRRSSSRKQPPRTAPTKQPSRTAPTKQPSRTAPTKQPSRTAPTKQTGRTGSRNPPRKYDPRNHPSRNPSRRTDPGQRMAPRKLTRTSAPRLQRRNDVYRNRKRRKL